MRGQQAIKAAAIRGEEIPMGHVVTEEWPKQTYAVRKLTRSWVKKRKEKEAKKRYAQNKQARVCRVEQAEVQSAAPKLEKKEQPATPPKHVQRRERAKQEREAKRLLVQQEREKRKREDDEHKARRHNEREERKRKQEQKRERRLRAREEREQERMERLCWHQEIAEERALRLARKLERATRLAFAAQANHSASSSIFVDYEALAPLPKPP